MTHLSRGFSRFAALLASFTLPLAASAQTASKEIIPLPLNPVVGVPQRSCDTKTASGLGVSVLKPGTSAKPTDGDVVLLDYIGYLAATGAVFDQGQRAPLAVTDVIPGFTEGLKGMSRGATHRFCIPAALGYGAREAGPIPANSDLVFQVTLLDFKSKAEIEAMRKAAEAQGAAPPQPQQPQGK